MWRANSLEKTMILEKIEGGRRMAVEDEMAWWPVTMNREQCPQTQMFKLGLETAQEPEIKLPTSTGSSKKQESSRKTSTSALLTMPKPWLCESQQTGRLFKRWEYQTTWPASCEICMQAKKQKLELDMEQHTGSK